ncbi:MAG TPA: hypothetical protein VJV97_01600 [Gemmatimonadaceae bacterium]|nr:hypothetical protein [Gemmatimonadaceae bacterium]
MWPLLIAVQFVELLWILFTYLGIEHARVTPNAVHLDFLPYSHSAFTGVLLAAIAWGFGKSARRSNVGAAVALGILSHVLLDVIQHEPNITLLPLEWGPRLGLNLQGCPVLDFLVELAFCIACWVIFRGTKGLLVGIVVFNVINIPLMFPRPGSLQLLMDHHNLLPTLVLFQVVATWLVVWWLGRRTMFLEAAIPGPPG